MPRTRTKKVEDYRPEVNLAFKVRAKGSPVRIRLGPGISFSPILDKTVNLDPVTVVSVSEGAGSKSGWGELADGSGWIALEFVERV